AQQALSTHRADLAASDADQFTVRSTTVDPDGTSYVRYDRTYHGLAVLGGDVVINLDRTGGFRAATRGLAAPLSLSTTPRLDAGQALRVATGAFHGTGAPA